MLPRADKVNRQLKEGEAYAPPSFSCLFCCLLGGLSVLSWLCLAGEYELQNRYGERDHSHADDRPGGNDGGCGTFVPIVGLQDDDIRGWRQDRKDEEHLRMREQLVEVHSSVRVHPVCGGEYADAVDAHEHGA